MKDTMAASRPEGAKGELLERAWGLYGINPREHFALCRKDKDDLDLTCSACWRVHTAITLCAEYAREQVKKVFHETGPPTISEQWLRDAHSRGVDVVEAVTEYANVRAQLQTLRGEKQTLEDVLADERAELAHAIEVENALTQEKAALEAKIDALNTQYYSSRLGPCEVHETFTPGCVRCIVKRLEQGESHERAQVLLLRKIANAKDRMDWWRELDQFLNALDALAPRRG